MNWVHEIYKVVIVGEQEGSETGAIELVQVSVTVNVDSLQAGSIQDETLLQAGYKLIKCWLILHRSHLIPYSLSLTTFSIIASTVIVDTVICNDE